MKKFLAASLLPLGTIGAVLAFDPQHEFEGGVPAPGYQVQLQSAEKAVWVPARDLNRNCKAR